MCGIEDEKKKKRKVLTNRPVFKRKWDRRSTIGQREQIAFCSYYIQQRCTVPPFFFTLLSDIPLSKCVCVCGVRAWTIHVFVGL